MPRETVASVRAELQRHLALAEEALKVWQQRAIRAERQVDDLTKALVKVSTPAAAPKHKPRQGVPDVEGQAVQRAERTVKAKAAEAFLERATKDFTSKGYPAREAAREAKKMLDEAMGMQTPAG